MECLEVGCIFDEADGELKVIGSDSLIFDPQKVILRHYSILINKTKTLCKRALNEEHKVTMAEIFPMFKAN